MEPLNPPTAPQPEATVSEAKKPDSPAAPRPEKAAAEKRKLPKEAVTLLRTTQQHHVQLSMMADQKANMLIGATFVVFTLAIGQGAAEAFSLPLLILAGTAFASAAFGALAVLPKTTPPATGNRNWLFFGNFSEIDADSYYEELVNSHLSSQEDVHRAMSLDIHQMGMVLAKKKYRYLGLAYRVFLIGLTLTFAVYVLEQLAGPLL